MEQDLREKEPKLHEMEKETDELMAQINKESVEVVQPKKR